MVEDNMTIDHWMLADQMSLIEQLGVIPMAEVAHLRVLHN